MLTKKKPVKRDREKEALKSENADLKRRLADTEQHRHLLIESLHRLTMQAGAGYSPAIGAPGVTIDTILKWLINTIENLTASRPVQGNRTLSDLMVPIPRLVKLTNSQWFPHGGGFTDIPGTTAVGDLAETIYQKLQ